MKQKLLKSIFIVVVVASSIGGFKVYNSNLENGSQLLLENIEAFSDYIETTTTWVCDAAHKKECQMSCGRCKTIVRGTGNASGSHSCTIVVTPKNPFQPCKD